MEEDVKKIDWKCPVCQSECAVTKDNSHRPFCSATCKNRDFLSWSEEEYRVAGEDLDPSDSGDGEVADEET